MNKEITIYELLGLIKDDMCKSICIKYLDEEKPQVEVKETGFSLLRDLLNEYLTLDEKVEIIEEDKDIELLNLDTDKLKGKEVIRAIDYLLEGKINELIREVNKLRKENNNG